MLQVSSSSIIISLIFLCRHFLIFKCVISSIPILKKFQSSVLRNAWYDPYWIAWILMAFLATYMWELTCKWIFVFDVKFADMNFVKPFFSMLLHHIIHMACLWGSKYVYTYLLSHCSKQHSCYLSVNEWATPTNICVAGAMRHRCVFIGMLGFGYGHPVFYVWL